MDTVILTPDCVEIIPMTEAIDDALQELGALRGEFLESHTVARGTAPRNLGDMDDMERPEYDRLCRLETNLAQAADAAARLMRAVEDVVVLNAGFAKDRFGRECVLVSKIDLEHLAAMRLEALGIRD